MNNPIFPNMSDTTENIAVLLNPSSIYIKKETNKFLYQTVFRAEDMGLLVIFQVCEGVQISLSLFYVTSIILIHYN